MPRRAALPLAEIVYRRVDLATYSDSLAISWCVVDRRNKFAATRCLDLNQRS
jgi:hypothetical protein